MPRKSWLVPAMTSVPACGSAPSLISSSTNGARYRDKRPVAKEMWKTMMRALQADWGVYQKDNCHEATCTARQKDCR